MVSWDVVLGLMVIVFALPFIFLSSKMKSTRERARISENEVRQMRGMLAELQEHVQRDQSLFLEALGVPFLLMRPGGRVVMANRKACDLFGFESLTNTNLLRILPESDMRSLLHEAAGSSEKVRALVHVPRQEGERIYRTTATRLATRERHIGIVFLDVTEEHRTQVIRRDFVANASHELRTPLTLIQGYLETLLDDPESAADTGLLQRSLGVMKRHADRMTRLVADMLMLSRVEAPDSSYLKEEDFDLLQLATEVKQRLENMAAAQSATVGLQIEPRPYPMHGDSFYWSQVLYNLMENALKNNPSPGLQVKLTASLTPDGAPLLCVEDNGCGIPLDAIPFIFNRFYRADSTGKVKGTGLGLAIVKHAVEAHGGSIRCESIPGTRTCFIITLPRNPESAPQTRADHAYAATGPRL